MYVNRCFLFFVVDDLSGYYDDVIIVQQISNDKTGMNFKIIPYRNIGIALSLSLSLSLSFI